MSRLIVTCKTMVCGLSLVLALADAQADEGVTAQAYEQGLRLLERFNGLEPFVGEEPNAKRLRRECQQLNRRCIKFLRGRPALARRSLPNNQQYWDAYHELLMLRPIARYPEDIDQAVRNSGVIEATRLWPYREVLNSDTLAIADLHDYVSAHRHWLAESNFLIDKMIYTATTAIALAAINVSMAQHATHPLEPDDASRLWPLIEPLTGPERSLRRTFEGEHRYMRYQLNRHPHASAEIAQVEAAKDIFDYVAERSERSWSAFWGDGLDVWSDVPLPITREELPNWSNYAANIRNVDTLLLLLRALREVYEGRASPGIPNLPAPSRWQWDWRGETQELCLEPVDIHHTLSPHTQAICMEYLEWN